MNEKNTNENRKHKDSLFVDYFSKDRDWKEHFLSLYNALHGHKFAGGDHLLGAGKPRAGAVQELLQRHRRAGGRPVHPDD